MDTHTETKECPLEEEGDTLVDETSMKMKVSSGVCQPSGKVKKVSLHSDYAMGDRRIGSLNINGARDDEKRASTSKKLLSFLGKNTKV